MRATIKNYIQAEQERREESGEKGFSLIELIIVVVILGILAAIAIPVFLGIQGTAQTNARDAAAANGAAQAAAAFAQGATTVDLSNLDDGEFTVALVSGSAAALEDVCVSATDGDGVVSQAGPGCTPAPTPTT